MARQQSTFNELTVQGLQTLASAVDQLHNELTRLQRELTRGDNDLAEQIQRDPSS